MRQVVVKTKQKDCDVNRGVVQGVVVVVVVAEDLNI